MCGRYAISHTAGDLQSLFDVVNPQDFAVEQRYNIAPTQLVPMVFRNREGERSAGNARWGLVPGWVKNPSDWKASTFNARSEEVANKPTFRNAFKRGRVLIPASGFYEWKREGGSKTPYHIRKRNGEPLAFAGLMDIWRDRESDDRLVSCTILTTASAGPIEELHNRMPVMVAKEEFDTWLSGDDSEAALQEVLASPPLDEIELYPVSSAVNNTRNDDPSFVTPLA